MLVSGGIDAGSEIVSNACLLHGSFRDLTESEKI